MMLGMHPWIGLSDDVRLGVLTEWVAADLQAGRVGVLVPDGTDGEPGRGRDGADGGDDDVVAGQGAAAPGQADLAEQPVLDLVPLRRAGPMPLLVGCKLSFRDR